MANVLVNAGRALITALLTGSGSVPKYIGWGTGAGTSAATDTTLFAEKAQDLTATTGTRVTGTQSQQTTSVANDTLRVAGTFTAGGTGGSPTNIGVFDNATIGSGNLLVKADFAAIAMSSGDTLAIQVNLQFT